MPKDSAEVVKAFEVRREVYEWAQALVTAVIAFVLIYTFGARIIGVDGHSMEPTLHDEEKLLISKLFYKPDRGDVIMFTKKGVEVSGYDMAARPQPLVKRVVGLPGDVIDIDSGSIVYVNGVAIDEPYIKEHGPKRGDAWEYPVTVPEGCLFVMGDNRSVSLDSRYSSVGMVDQRCVLGKVLLRVYPFDDFGSIG